jgi:hypothetical protein
MSKARQQVFLSYSREPPEEAAFARALAGRLRAAGFDPWLDEEQVPEGADLEAAIRKAIPAASHAVFLITMGWLKRPSTRLELGLFEKHPDKNRRMVAVERENLPQLKQAAQAQQLKVVRWLPQDADADARFWLLYCALTGKPQGPEEGWAEEGRKLSGTAGPEPVAPRPSEDDALWCPCRGRPILVCPSAHGTLLASDADECFLLGGAGSGGREPLPDLRGCAMAAVGGDGTLVAGRYSPMLARLGPGGWEFRAVGAAPVLALAATPHGLAVGDADGNVILLPDAGGPQETVRLGEPVIDLCPHQGGLAALGAGGLLGRLGWADGWETAFEPVRLPEAFGRPTELFPLGKQGRVGLVGADQLAVLDVAGGAVKVAPRAHAAGLRQVVYLERKPAAYGILTDAGELSLLEADLETARPLPLPGETQEVGGLARSPAGGLLAWTADGLLFAISREGAVRRLVAERVVLAHAEAGAPGQVLVVTWAPREGARLRQLHTDGAR